MSDKCSPPLFSKMPRTILQFSFQLLFVFLSLFPPKSEPLKVETKALLEFKSHLKDPLGHLNSWIETNHLCNFSGVSCDPLTRTVTTISFNNASLSGELSPSLCLLQSLHSLVLPSSSIFGSIPPQLDHCMNLRVLNLSFNRMVGKIPDLSGLVNLEVLDLSGNFFTGEFPSWVSNLKNLVSLWLGHNDFNEGEIPNSIENLKNLTLLFLSNCNRIGEIPESVFGLKELSTFDLSRNKLSGKLSSSISKLRKLTKIELFANNLTGEIPPEIGNLTLLQEIDISANHFYGKLPQEIGNLTSLTVFQSYENYFTGDLPSGFGDLQHLKGFSVYRNSFSGEFPSNFGRFSPLNSIDISENNFTGPFPSYLCQNKSLHFLLALNNDFYGDFPASYADCKSLVRFRVNRNRLSGKLPDGMWALPHVDIIDLSDNHFSGSIPPEIGVSVSLSQLILMNNRFLGELPSEIENLSRLERLYLNNNSFSGEIPPQLGGLKQLSSLQLQENSFTGTIPPELGHCTRLADLNVAGNSLNGNIPSTFSLMSSINSLNLSRNELSGPIPKSLGKLKLSSVDLTQNQLSGVVPSDLLAIGGEDAFLGNKGLCVDGNFRTRLRYGINICNSVQKHKKGLRNELILPCIILSVLVLTLAGLLLVHYKNYKVRSSFQEDLEPKSDIDLRWKIESFHHLEFDADEVCNLGEENLIGNGGTGKVYRLDLKKNGGTVAVKQLWGGASVKVLYAEMEIMGKIRHRNILKLYACLMKGRTRFLVFEFMANGNVSEALHRQLKDGEPELDWYRRYKIALGVAKGIAYLHHDCLPPIIHRDIKSTNILLDEDYEPKIADFGVAKANEDSPNGSDYSCFVGTHGYIAPELAYTCKITEKNDVYSFGVVLLELLTGRRPIEEQYGEGRDIVDWVLSHLNDKKSELSVLDPSVVSDAVKEYMIRVLKIAIVCTTKLPFLRPPMRDVVKMLVDADPFISKHLDQ